MAETIIDLTEDSFTEEESVIFVGESIRAPLRTIPVQTGFNRAPTYRKSWPITKEKVVEKPVARVEPPPVVQFALRPF